jgi:hypothetical protein
MRMSYDDKQGRFITRKGWLIISYIPVVVGVAALTWAWAVNDWMGLGVQYRADKRAQQSVGEPDPPKATITLKVHSSNCLVDGNGRIDGTDAWFYVRNKCDHWLDQSPNYLYHVEASDGTVIESGQYAFDGAKQIGPGERREQKVAIKASDRTASVEIWMIDK